MGSRHFGELPFGTESSSSSRKGKKSNSDKPKQPQRGLGVAQLEKIRLQSQMAGYLPSHHSPFHSNFNKKEEDMRVDVAFTSSPSITAPSSSLFPLHSNNMMTFGENEITDIRHEGFQSNPRSRSMMNRNEIFRPQDFAPKTVTLPLLEQSIEDSLQKKRRHDHHHSARTISQNSDSADTQELDLDLKLSL